MLSPIEVQKIEVEFSHYPDRKALCIEALKVVRRQRGLVPKECIRDIAEMLDMSPQAVGEVAHFCAIR